MAGADQKGSSSGSKTMSVLSLNTTKAGMEGLDKERINAIVTEASKGSKFYDAKSKNQVTFLLNSCFFLVFRVFHFRNRIRSTLKLKS